MKNIGTLLFLIACLGLGALLGTFIFQHRNQANIKVPRIEPTFGGALPEVRGEHSHLTIQSPLDQWKEQAKHDAALGATWMEIDLPAGPFDVVTLPSIVSIAHDAKLKAILVAAIPHYNDPPGLLLEAAPRVFHFNQDYVYPPKIDEVTPIITAANIAGVDILAIDPNLGEAEPADAAWVAFIPEVKKRSKAPLCYIAAYYAAPRVTWWTSVDYVGVRGPILLTDRPDVDLHKMQMSWRCRQDLIMYLHLRDNVPVLFFDVGFPEQGNRTDIEYEAALSNLRGQPWLAGLFVRLPADHEMAGRIEKIVQEQWH